MSIIVSDSRAVNVVTKDLGIFEIKFNKDYVDELNDRIHPDYQLKDQILNEFVEPPPPNTSVVPKIFSLVLIGVLIIFLTLGINSQVKQFSYLGSNLWTILYVLNYLVIYFIIVKFWLNTRLDTTLWTLLAMVPSTFITLKYGLSADKCSLWKGAAKADSKVKVESAEATQSSTKVKNSKKKK